MRVLSNILGDAFRLKPMQHSLCKAEQLSELMIEAMGVDIIGGDYRAITRLMEKQNVVVKTIATDLDETIKFLHEREDT